MNDRRFCPGDVVRPLKCDPDDDWEMTVMAYEPDGTEWRYRCEWTDFESRTIYSAWFDDDELIANKDCGGV